MITNWTCPKKSQARRQTLFHPINSTQQYWTMAGDSTTEGCELNEVLGARLIEPHQFHGVEIRADIHKRNKEAHPNINWYHGDFLTVMSRYRGFNPGIVNADLIQTPITASEYVAKLMNLLTPFSGVTLVANFVLRSRQYSLSPQAAIDMLADRPLFRQCMRLWEFDGECYEYAGTGRQSRTRMGTFVFTRRPRQLLAAA